MPISEVFNVNCLKYMENVPGKDFEPRKGFKCKQYFNLK